MVDNVNSGDTLYLYGETFKQSLGGKTVHINKNITINGGSKDNSNLVATIDCNEKNNAFELSNGVTASFMNILFIKGKSDYGGAIYAPYYCNVNIVNCNFSNNRANRQGGAVYVNDNSRLSITNSTFLYNCADKGGAIYSAKNTDFKINGSVFKSNSALYEGGTIFMDGGTGLNAYNCHFSDSFSYNRFGGGAIFGYENITVIDSTFIHTEAIYNYKTVSADLIGRGGAICSFWGNVTVINSSFTDTKAKGGLGGAIYCGGNVVVTKSNFTNTISTYSGNAIYCGGTATVTKSNFANMGTCCSGGAIFGNKCITVANSTFTDTNAGSNGGAIFGHENVTVINSTFNKNCGCCGGAVYSEGGILTVLNSSFINTKATGQYGGDGGALFAGVMMLMC